MKKENISDLRIYLSSKDSRWFWVSLVFIFLFFIFSWVTSENILILFIKRATTLAFTFLVPGYVITRAIYPRKNEINAIEQFAFSVAFSLTFVMFTGYILSYVWEITDFSWAIATFLLALGFNFFALLRCIRLQDINTKTSTTIKKEIIILALICAFALILKSVDSIASPVLRAYDPYDWVRYTKSLIRVEHIPDSRPWSRGYPAGFSLITSWLTLFLDVDAYTIIRYLHIFSFLNIIPAYLFTNYIFKSRDISLLAVVLMFSTKYIFYRTSISIPESLVHFFLILALYMLLKTIEKPNSKNALLAGLLFSSTILEYHMPIQFLAPFLIVIFLIIFINAHLNKNLKSSAQVKAAAIIGCSIILISGILWYFWQLDRAFEYLKGTQGIFPFIERQATPRDINYIISQLGIFLTIFSLMGVAFILLNKKIKDARCQFLIIYFIVIYLLFLSPHFGLKRIHASYMLSYLVLPASILASYGFLNSFNLISKYAPVSFLPFFSGRKMVLIIFVLFIFNYMLFFNYSPSKKAIDRDIGLFSKNLDGDRLYKALFLRFRTNAPFTLNEYLAYAWVADNTPRNTRVIAWVSKGWVHRVLTKRDIIRKSNLKINSNSRSTDILRKIWARRGKGIYHWYLLVGIKPKSLLKDEGRDFSKETLASIESDPNFKPVYQNEQIRIYRILPNYIVPIRVGGFTDNFTDTFLWGADLHEKDVLRPYGKITIYNTSKEPIPIDIDFSKGLDTKIYPYFEIRMKVVRGKISIGVYDSTGEEYVFLRNYSTNGEWETYKFNLNKWLIKNGYETEIYGVRFSNTLSGDPSFRTLFDWISIHNHIFWDDFKDGNKVLTRENITMIEEGATLSRISTNLVLNPSFEGAGDNPENWKGKGSPSYESEECRTGRCVKVDLRNYYYQRINSTPIKNNTTYIYSIHAKESHPGNNSVRVMVRVFNTGKKGTYHLNRIKANSSYVKYERRFTTPEDTKFINVYATGTKKDEQVYIDDVSLIEESFKNRGYFESIVFENENPIISVTPAWSSVEPDKNKNITIEISVDNGTTWKLAKNGMPINYTFDESNRFLKYRAFFRTNDNHHSPILRDITLVYKEQLHKK